MQDKPSIAQKKDEQNGEIRNTVQKIDISTPPKSKSRCRKIKNPFANLHRQPIKPKFPKNITPQVYLAKFTKKYPIASASAPVPVATPAPQTDTYEEDFIDDSALPSGQKYWDKSNPNYNILKSHLKTTYNHKDYSYNNEEDVEEVGFEGVQAEERRTELIGRREDRRELERMGKS
jgi:hypothetical protein